MKEELPTRKRNRLENFDYSSSKSYFVTICCLNRKPLLWADAKQKCTSAEDIILSGIGKTVEQAILQMPDHYKGVVIDKYCIMPEHVHVLLFIETDPNGITTSAPEISVMIGQMKRWVTRHVKRTVWQKSFYDHVVRSGREYNNIWRYIDRNPSKMDHGDETELLELYDAIPEKEKPPHRGVRTRNPDRQGGNEAGR